MKSISVNTGAITLPMVNGEFSMIPFDLDSLEGLSDQFKKVAGDMLENIKHLGGVAHFTIHGKKLQKGGTLRRGGPHTDGNFKKNCMSFGGGGGGNGWKVGEDGPGVDTALHHRQYCKPTGGIVMASNYESCLGWSGDYDGLPSVGGDCSHLTLDHPFLLERNRVYYGNNHFIHESMPVGRDVHRVLARITLPENHEYSL